MDKKSLLRKRFVHTKLLVSAVALALAQQASAAVYHIGVSGTDTATDKYYASLEALRLATPTFASGDVISLNGTDNSLMAAINFGSANVGLSNESGSVVTVTSATSSMGSLFSSTSGNITVGPSIQFQNTDTTPAPTGGVFNTTSGTITLNDVNSVFTGNIASGGGGAIAGLSTSLSKVVVNGDLTLNNNHSQGYYGGGINASTITVNGNIYGNDNSAKISGGTIFGNLEVTGNITIDNSHTTQAQTSAQVGGGALNAQTYLHVGGTTTITNSLSGQEGGAIYLTSSNSGVGGIFDGDVTLNYNTANKTGGGIHQVWGGLQFNRNVTMIGN